MKIKETVFNKWKTAIIDIEKIDVDCNNIIEILNLFEFDNIIVIADSIAKVNNIFKDFNQGNIKYTTLFTKKESQYMQIIIMLKKENLSLLKKLVDMKVDLYIFDKKNEIQWEQYLYKINKSLYNKLLKEKDVNFTIDCWQNESRIDISYNTEIYDSTVINEKIRQIVSED